MIILVGGIGKAKKSQVISDEIISQKTVENGISQSSDSDSQLRKRNRNVKKTADQTLMISDVQTLRETISPLKRRVPVIMLKMVLR